MAEMAWKIKFSPEAEKDWDKLEPLFQKKIINFLSKRLKTGEDPKLFAKPLTGNLKNFWRFRVGDYRLICDFNEKEKLIHLVHIGPRRDVYKNVHFLTSSL